MAETIGVDPPALAVPLNDISAAHTSVPLAAPLPILRPAIIPTAQQAAPLVPFPATLSVPSVIPATVISYTTRVFGPPAFPYAPALLALAPAISGPLRSRFSYRRRPSTIAVRRYPTHSAYRRYS